MWEMVVKLCSLLTSALGGGVSTLISQTGALNKHRVGLWWPQSQS